MLMWCQAGIGATGGPWDGGGWRALDWFVWDGMGGAQPSAFVTADIWHLYSTGLCRPLASRGRDEICLIGYLDIWMIWDDDKHFLMITFLLDAV